LQKQKILGDSAISHSFKALPATSQTHNLFNADNQSTSTHQFAGATGPWPYQLQGTLRRKIKVARWLSRKVAEYDVGNEFWSLTEAEVEQPFHAFSATIYLPN